MKITKSRWSKMLQLGMISMVLTFELVFSGCAINKASTKSPSMEKKPIAIEGRDYTILGTVQLEKKWFGILGFSIAAGHVATDVYVFQKGGVSYSDLLAEARNQYPDADAVVDIQVDYEGSTYAVFYSQRKNIVTGVAIKYVRGPASARTAIDVHLK